MTSIQKWALAAVVIGMGVAGYLGLQGNKADPQVALIQQLEEIAQTVNAALPITLDADTQLTAVKVDKQALIYHYAFLTAVHDGTAPKQLIDQLRPALVEAACTTPLTADLIQQGAQLRHVYTDSVGEHKVSITIGQFDCQ
ncbi:hypothetical protein ACFFLZ_07875 [Photobacterium aphoticum]|nr:hypothetical protein [Photobacterium aphoticum]PSU56304.1 hypothetical protein C9I90_13390 [Photobacterium aphoticum]GHA50237.1 hypothetical protein GCM10007086_25230 [Photobacterium aphoticum]